MISLAVGCKKFLWAKTFLLRSSGKRIFHSWNYSEENEEFFPPRILLNIFKISHGWIGLYGSPWGLVFNWDLGTESEIGMNVTEIALFQTREERFPKRCPPGRVSMADVGWMLDSKSLYMLQKFSSLLGPWL